MKCKCDCKWKDLKYLIRTEIKLCKSALKISKREGDFYDYIMYREKLDTLEWIQREMRGLE